MDSSPEAISKEEGLRLLKAGQLDDAIKVLEKVREKIDDAQVCAYLGAAYSQKGDKISAVRAFEESLRLNETPKAYFNLAVAYEAVSRIDEAVREYEMAVHLDPNYAPAQEALRRHQQQFAQAQPAAAGVASSTQAIPAGPPSASQTQSFAGPPPDGPMIGQAPRMPEPLVDPFAQQFAPPPTAADLMQRQMEKEQAVADQAHAMMKNGVIYGAVCGAIFFVLANFASKVVLPTAMPTWAASGGGLLLYIFIIALVGSIYGSIVGLWVGYTCGGESAGMQAGGAMGALLGLALGLLTGSIGGALICMVAFAVVSGITGLIIGRMVDASISD